MLRKSLTRRVVVNRPAGLHARPCLAIVQAVRRFQCEVRIDAGSKTANAAEITDLLCLGAGQGQELILSARGKDAEAVLDALAQLFNQDFGLFD